MSKTSIVTLAMAAAAILLMTASVAMETDGETQISHQLVEGKTYIFSLPGDVMWDFGDGTALRSDGPVAHSFALSGAHTVTASVDGRTYQILVVIHDDAPALRAGASSEYRYAPAGDVTDASVTDLSTGVQAAWISWDPDAACLRGTPPISAVGKTFLVRLVIDGTGEAYDLTIDAGTAGVTARFSTDVSGLDVSLQAEYQSYTALYYWSLYNSAGTKVSVDVGRTGSMTAPAAGTYLIRLSVVSSAGSAEYSQMVSLTEEHAPVAPDYVMYAGAVLTVLALILIVRFFI